MGLKVNPDLPGLVIQRPDSDTFRNDVPLREANQRHRPVNTMIRSICCLSWRISHWQNRL